MNIILLGPPGSGKGTQSTYIVQKYKIEHISTGDILRSEISKKSELGIKAKTFMEKGDLVTDELIIEMVSNTIQDMKSILLDGFPRTLKQALSLEKEMNKSKKNVDYVLYFDVPYDDLITRLSRRISCKSCSTTFTKNDQNFVCPKDCKKQELYQREDDKPEAVRKRMETYKKLTQPLLEFYKEKEILVKINANSSISEVSLEIDKILQ